MMNEIKIDGSRLPKSLDLRNINWIEIKGNDLFQNNQIENYIKQMEFKEQVKTLSISYGTVLENLEILKYFSNLERFIVMSHTISSFKGLENFSKGKFLLIETGKDKKRSLTSLSSNLTLEVINLEFGNWGDYEAISKCTSLESIAIGNGPAPDFKTWSRVPLKFIKFWDYCKFTELKDMNYLPELQEVMIGACRKFECFKGDNSNIKKLIIDGSKRFDIKSLETCPSLEKLNILGSIPLISLDDFPVLKHLKTMELVDIKIDFGKFELEKKMPNLEMIYFTKGTKDEIINLSKNNENILVCKSNGKGYIKGIKMYDDFEWLQKKS